MRFLLTNRVNTYNIIYVVKRKAMYPHPPESQIVLGKGHENIIIKYLGFKVDTNVSTFLYY